MRIIYLSPRYTSPFLAYKYADALSKAGTSVRVFATTVNAQRYAQGIVQSDVPFTIFPNNWNIPFVFRFPWLNRLRIPLPSRRLLGALLREAADVYIVGQPDDLPLAAFMARLNRARLVYIPFEYYPGLSYGDRLSLELFEHLERRYAPRVNRWVSLGDKLTELYIEKYGIADKVFTVYSSIPRIVDTRPRGLRQLIGAGPNTVVMLYTGQISTSRGLWDVLTAMPDIPENVVFVVMGGKDNDLLRREVVARELQRRVHVLDSVPQSELMGYTAEADIGIIPIHNVCESYWNCNPGKLFEYIGAGLPLAVSNLAQLGWYVRSRSLGEVFEPESPGEIAVAIRRLATDHEYRRTCALNSKRVHEEEACWEIQSERLRHAVLE